MLKLAVIGLIIATLATGAIAQEGNPSTAVTLRFPGISLKAALDSIERQFRIRLSYSDTKINAGRMVDGVYSAGSSMEFLAKFLEDQDLQFTIIDDQIVVFPINSNQTIKIVGRVTNTDGDSPVSYASVTLPDILKGTSTNEEGEFQLFINALPAQLTISHIAYEKKVVFVYDDQQDLEIRLEQAPRTLSEVVVKSKRDKNAYYQLLKNSRELINASLNNAQYGKAFYRQKSERQNRYTEIFEMFYDLKYNRNGITDWAVQEGRYAFQNKDEYDVFLYNKNFTLLSRMFSLLQPATDSYILPFHPDVKDLFELSLQEIIEYDGRHIAVIHYKPYPSVGKPAAEGLVYIDYETADVFKMTGTFTNSKLDIIGFSDNDSSWDNYKLSFDISFSDNDAGNLVLDYIRVDHFFDYYFRKEFVGNIHTNSFLSIYEHYTPAAAKKLGGPVDFKNSDSRTIDRIGYNREFWLQNPIVKRTPLEEKLILDFDNNEAFGVVFLNLEDKVILLPDRKNSENAKKVISAFEAASPHFPDHRVALLFDKPAYKSLDKVRFSGYVVDTWTLRPSVTGSVLNINLLDENNSALMSKVYDVSDGAVYGEYDLAGLKPGIYELSANLNTDKEILFSRQLLVLPDRSNGGWSSGGAVSREIKRVEIAVEGGLLLADMSGRVIIAGIDDRNNPVPTNWVLTDDLGNLIMTINTGLSGIGELNFVPLHGRKYFVRQAEAENATLWPLPLVSDEGTSLMISDRNQNSLRLEIRQKPVFPADVNIISSSGGKVLSIYEKKITSTATIVDLPVQHLPPGINKISLSDANGRVIVSRQVFIEPAKLSVRAVSAAWKSKKNHKLELTFQIADEFGAPAQANLCAIYGQDPLPVSQQLASDLFFNNSGIPIDWVSQLSPDQRILDIDKLMILAPEELNRQQEFMDISAKKQPDNTEITSEKIIAEIAVSGIATKSESPVKLRNESISGLTEAYWHPKLSINQEGKAVIDCRALPGSALAISIQGISDNGVIANFMAIIDPDTLRDSEKNKQNKYK